jgi:Flp pilus assembly protein TadD
VQAPIPVLHTGPRPSPGPPASPDAIAAASLADSVTNRPEYLALARAASRGEPQPILRAARNLLRVYPTCTFARMQMAIAYGNLGEDHAAEGACEEALRIDPSYLAGWRLLGIFCAGTGDQEEAVQAWRTAVRIAPGDSTTWELLAMQYARCGRGVEAREALASLARTAPGCAAQLAPAVEGASPERPPGSPADTAAAR